MFSHIFLAMTDKELAEYHPQKVAYMACHFSTYNNGLSNLPRAIPKGSLLLLDDSTPPWQHNQQVVSNQLKMIAEQFSIKAILLDFQGEKTEESTAMAKHLVHNLPCAVAVTEQYAKAIGCPVLLSPPPANRCLDGYLKPWLQQGIYLEIAPMAAQITVTQSGSTSLPIPYTKDLPLFDKRLLCHYDVESFPQKAVFTLCRTKEDLTALVRRAKEMGVLGCIGLYQELSPL